MSQLNERAKRWVFTYNNYDPKEIEEQILQLFQALNIKYIVYGKEKGENGTPHIQGYFRLNQIKYRSQIKPIMNECFRDYPYLAVARGTEVDNFKYCTKEGNWKEYGEKTAEAERTVTKEEHIKKIMHDWLTMSQDQFNDTHPYESLHWRNKLMQWESQRTIGSNAWTGGLKSKNIWIFGPPGTGKSRWARSQCEEWQIYPKGCNKWWGGFDARNHKMVLFEDFPADGRYLGQLMKIWADRYTFTAEVKGGSIKVNPGTFVMVVTANYSIDDVFGSGSEDGKALKRRFTEVRIDDEGSLFLQSKLQWDQIALQSV